MLKSRSLWLLALAFLFGACAPEGNKADEDAFTEADKHLVMFVGYGLTAANEGLIALEAEADEFGADADTVVSEAVARLRTAYERLNDRADSLLAAADSTTRDQRLGLREEIVELTRSVEETRFALIDESQRYQETAERRLSELDQRLYQLTADIDEAGLSEHFGTMMAQLTELRDAAALEVAKLESATTDRLEDVRTSVTDAMATFSARLTEAETEYDTAAGESGPSMTFKDEIDRTAAARSG